MYRTIINSLIFVLFPGLVLAATIEAAEVGDPERSIKQVRGDLYRAQVGDYFTMVLVTDEGVIITDPQNTEYASWLKEEVTERFGKPIKYVLYSHSDFDHAEGGQIFDDSVIFIGNEKFREHLFPSADTPLPDSVSLLDTNGNGVLDRSETRGVPQNRLTYIPERIIGIFDDSDVNRDDRLTGAEITDWLTRDVREPDIYYRDKMQVRLGGQTVELIYTGRNHTDDMSVVYFPEQKTVYAVDFIKAKNVPFSTMDDFFFPDIIDSIKEVEKLDFDIFAAAHGAMGNKQDVIDHRVYFEELMAAVSKGIEEGKTVEELQETITMDAYRDWREYDAYREENVAGMYRTLGLDE